MLGLWTLEAANRYKLLNPVLQYQLNHSRRCASDPLPHSFRAKSVWTFRYKTYHYDLTLLHNSSNTQLLPMPSLTATQQNLGSLRTRIARFYPPITQRSVSSLSQAPGTTHTFNTVFWLTPDLSDNSLMLLLAEEEACVYEEALGPHCRDLWKYKGVVSMGSEETLTESEIGNVGLAVLPAPMTASRLEVCNLKGASGMALVRCQFRTSVLKKGSIWYLDSCELVVVGNREIMKEFEADSTVTSFCNVPLAPPSVPVIEFIPSVDLSLEELFEHLCDLSKSVDWYEPARRTRAREKKPARVHRSTGLEYSGSEDLCIICFDALAVNEQLKMPGCQHSFHRECLKAWILRGSSRREECIACPICLQVQVRNPGNAPAGQMKVYFIRRERKSAETKAAVKAGAKAGASVRKAAASVAGAEAGASKASDASVKLRGFLIFVLIVCKAGVQESHFGHPIPNRKYATSYKVLTLPLSLIGLKTLSYYSKAFSTGLLLQFDARAKWGDPDQIIWNKIPFRKGQGIDDQEQLERVQAHCKRCEIELNRHDLQICSSLSQSILTYIDVSDPESLDQIKFKEEEVPSLPRQ